MSITFQSIQHAYTNAPVLNDINLTVEAGEIVCVLGPSGSGKSTLLKLVAGLETLQAGSISLPDLQITAQQCPPPERRPVGLVMQEHALFPHLSVAGNVGFGLSGRSRREQSERVESLLALAGLTLMADRYPHTLSGGQQQRVALARALAPEPAVMLLDEPFASIDVLLRNRLRNDTRRLLKASATTALLVTHDPADAMAVADRIAVIVGGELVQYDKPQVLWQRPAHPFVAEVLAGRQLFDAMASEKTLVSAFGTFESNTFKSSAENTQVKVAVAPSRIKLVPDLEGKVSIVDVRFSGEHFTIQLSSADQLLEVHLTDASQFRLGQSVAIEIAPGDVLIYG
ncbi:MAG: iron(III) transport system ATP-binding protein [Candidatus Azotimanducaceae bacterium]